jgi:FkbM family methyltransferase
MAHRDFPPYQAVDFILRNVLRRVPTTARAEQLALWWGARFQAAPRIIRLRDGSRMRAEPSDYLSALLYYLGTFEPHCLRLLARYLRPGGTMLDVGANIGVFTLTAARLVGPQGRVISVEAVPPNATTLRENIALNGFNWVTVIEAAAWSSDGVVSLGLPAGNGQPGCYSVGGDATFQARTRRLDDIVEEQGSGRVDLIKIDIEGSECEALRGASRLLADHKPIIIIEVNECTLSLCGASSGELIGILTAAGYRGEAISANIKAPLANVGAREYLFLPQGKPSR